MTIVLPSDYHAKGALEAARVVCISKDDAEKQDIRPLRIGILNVMPRAEEYEYSILNPLGRSIIQIEPVWIRLEKHEYKSSNREHIANDYVTFEHAIRNRGLDGLVLTGAPVEELAFEEVYYWEELKRILSYARRNIANTLGICWGGLALAYLCGVQKCMLQNKLFGVFATKNLERDHRITGDTDDVFWCPQSRHSGVADSEMQAAVAAGNLRALAHSDEVGYTIFESPDQRYLGHLGHPEYEPQRLIFEYERDVQAGRTDVLPPANMDIKNPVNVWRSHRNEFFSQWIKFIYDTAKY